MHVIHTPWSSKPVPQLKLGQMPTWDFSNLRTWATEMTSILNNLDSGTIQTSCRNIHTFKMAINHTDESNFLILWLLRESNSYVSVISANQSSYHSLRETLIDKYLNNTDEGWIYTSWEVLRVLYIPLWLNGCFKYQQQKLSNMLISEKWSRNGKSVF